MFASRFNFGSVLFWDELGEPCSGENDEALRKKGEEKELKLSVGLRQSGKSFFSIINLHRVSAVCSCD